MVDADDSATLEAIKKTTPARKTEAIALTVLCHPIPGRLGERALLPPGQTIELSRHTPGFAPSDSTSSGEPLRDRTMSRTPLLLRASARRLTIERNGVSGDVSIAGTALDRERTLGGEELERGVSIVIGPRVLLFAHLTELGADRDAARFGLFGDSPAMHQLRRQIRAIAPRNEHVLLRGESGSGKELVARALHAGSDRAKEPFVAVNLAAIPPSVAASELFGHMRGAFTGADGDRAGLFERAGRGILFLDEIGDASLELQVLLLRALETRTIQRVGGGPDQTVEARVIAATDADLEALIAQGKFRPALAYRLSATPIEVPPLRDRRADLGVLVRVFLAGERDLNQETTWLAPSWMQRLVEHSWPGNVRELRNLARRIAIAADDDDAGAEEIERLVQSVLKTPDPPRSNKTPSPEEITAAIEAAGNNMTQAAKALGLSRQALYRLLDKHKSG